MQGREIFEIGEGVGANITWSRCCLAVWQLVCACTTDNLVQQCGDSSSLGNTWIVHWTSSLDLRYSNKQSASPPGIYLMSTSRDICAQALPNFKCFPPLHNQHAQYYAYWGRAGTEATFLLLRSVVNTPVAVVYSEYTKQRILYYYMYKCNLQPSEIVKALESEDINSSRSGIWRVFQVV